MNVYIEDKFYLTFCSKQVLPIIKDAQGQHGLRHGDYQRYRYSYSLFPTGKGSVDCLYETTIICAYMYLLWFSFTLGRIWHFPLFIATVHVYCHRT